MTTSALDAKAEKEISQHPILATIIALGAVLGIVGGLALAFAAMLFVGSFIDGYVFWKLWAWFAQPLGMPALGYWAAIGVLSLVRFARPGDYHAEREGEGKVKTPIGNVIMRHAVYPPLVLGFGAFIHAMLIR